MSVYNPKTSRGKISFQKIVEASDSLFYTKGYYNTSIKDITEKAEVALGSFYTYFDSKYDAYKYLLEHYSHQIRSSISKNITSDMDRKTQERIGIRSFLIYVLEHPQCYNIIWSSLHIDEKLFNNYYQDFADRYVSQLKYAESKKQIISGHDLEVLAFLLMGAINFIGLRYIRFTEELQDKNDKKFYDRIDKVVDDVIFFLEEGIFEGKNERI